MEEEEKEKEEEEKAIVRSAPDGSDNEEVGCRSPISRLDICISIAEIHDLIYFCCEMQ